MLARRQLHWRRLILQDLQLVGHLTVTLLKVLASSGRGPARVYSLIFPCNNIIFISLLISEYTQLLDSDFRTIQLYSPVWYFLLEISDNWNF